MLAMTRYNFSKIKLKEFQRKKQDDKLVKKLLIWKPQASEPIIIIIYFTIWEWKKNTVYISYDSPKKSINSFVYAKKIIIKSKKTP